MYKQILVAVDNTKISQLALKEAINLTRDLNAQLSIVHVVDESFLSVSGICIDLEACQQSLKKEGQALLNNMKTITQAAGIEAQIYLVEMTSQSNRIAEKILEAIQNHNADLLVIGTHGRQGLPLFLMGSVAEEVLRTAAIPVLLVRGNGQG